MVLDLHYKSSETQHYNVQLKTGALANRVSERAMCDMRPADIDWLWIVEEKRRATPEEIRKLCKRAAMPSSQKGMGWRLALKLLRVPEGMRSIRVTTA